MAGTVTDQRWTPPRPGRIIDMLGSPQRDVSIGGLSNLISSVLSPKRARDVYRWYGRLPPATGRHDDVEENPEGGSSPSRHLGVKVVVL